MKLDKTIERCSELAARMMHEYEDDLIDAIMNLEDDSDEGAKPKLKVTLGFSIEPISSTKFEINASIGFTAKKISDKTTAIVDELQGELFHPESGINKVTIEAEGHEPVELYDRNAK